MNCILYMYERSTEYYCYMYYHIYIWRYTWRMNEKAWMCLILSLNIFLIFLKYIMYLRGSEWFHVFLSFLNIIRVNSTKLELLINYICLNSLCLSKINLYKTLYLWKIIEKKKKKKKKKKKNKKEKALYDNK